MAKIDRIKNKFVNILEVPTEIISDVPIVSMKGKEEVEIENYKGIIEYSDELVRVGVKNGILKIEGAKLFIKYITLESLLIVGKIERIEFI